MTLPVCQLSLPDFVPVPENSREREKPEDSHEKVAPGRVWPKVACQTPWQSWHSSKNSANSGRKLSLRKDLVAVSDVVARAAETAGHLIAARQQRLTISLPPELLYLKADPLRLCQVLTNLLSNAAKFTDPGGHSRLSAAADAGQIVFRVRDTGRGIAPDLLPQVFDPFHQIPGPAAQAKPGLGIGLALVLWSSCTAARSRLAATGPAPARSLSSVSPSVPDGTC
jgi:Histidine kinase-, DNA gyrase B-, and HSP90-like ATPase